MLDKDSPDRKEILRDIFRNIPPQRGLRGDKAVWDAMGKLLLKKELPRFAKDVEGLLLDTFKEIVGEYPTKGKKMEIPHPIQTNTGMTRGATDGTFWVQVGIPLLNELITGIFTIQFNEDENEARRQDKMRPKNVLWYDPSINSDENEICYQYLKEYFEIERFSSIDAVCQFLEQTDDLWCVITAGNGGQTLVKQIEDMETVSGIIVFCGSVSYHREWAKKYDKVLAVVSHVDEVKDNFEKFFDE